MRQRNNKVTVTIASGVSMLRHHALLLCLFSALAIHTTEIDNLTNRFTPLRDVRAEVNQIVNGYISEVVHIANQRKSCDEKTYLIPLSKRIGTGFVSKIEKEIQNDPSIDQVVTRRQESIFQDFSFFEAPGIFFTDLASLIKVNDVIVGTDKLGHFLGTGFSYYKRIHYKGKSLLEVLKYGDRTERLYYGMLINGVYSYADLAANLDGLSFWERVIGDHKQEPAPYVRCMDNHWSVNAPFDIADYINSAWDEGINCNRYRSQRLLGKVMHRITRLEIQNARSYQCPIMPAECQNMIERYGEIAQSIITPLCFSKYSASLTARN